MDNWGSVDSVGNNWSSMNGMVGNDWGSMDGMVGNNWGSMGNNWGLDGVDNSGLSLWEGSVGSNGWLDLSKSLGVVSLGDGGVGSSESLALAQGSDLTVGGGDRLVRGLSSDNSVVKGGMVGKKNWASWGSSVGELVGGLLSKVISNISSLHWGMVSWGSMDNWGSVDSVGNNWSSMNGMVGNDWGSMDGM